MSNKFDLIVVGGGPGGYVAAIRATQLGLKTALVEEKHLGGICLNWGCIPTKALLHGAEIAHELKHIEQFGFKINDSEFDINGLVKHSRDVSAKLAQGIAYLMKKNNITVINGRGKVTAKCQLSVEENGVTTNYSADHIILATGARPRVLPGLEPDGKLIWTYFEAMVPKALPKSLLVVGSGAIGMEFSSLYNDLGVDVTIVEVLDQVMPVEDNEVAKFAERAIKKRGMKVKLKTKVTHFNKLTDQVECTLVDHQGKEEKITVDRVIMAAGVVGNTENLGLESLGVEKNGSFINVDQWCKTNVVGLYAIGDVSGPPCLAHKASHEAVLCVEKLAGVANVHPIDKNKIPGCTYGRPQVASIGMTEKQAKQAGLSFNVGRSNYQSNGKAIAIADNEGFVKTLFDTKTGELLGAHMVGPGVTEQIQGFGIAQALEATEVDLINTIFAHPTLSESMHEAVLSSLDKGIH